MNNNISTKCIAFQRTSDSCYLCATFHPQIQNYVEKYAMKKTYFRRVIRLHGKKLEEIRKKLIKY